MHRQRNTSDIGLSSRLAWLQELTLESCPGKLANRFSNDMHVRGLENTTLPDGFDGGLRNKGFEGVGFKPI